MASVNFTTANAIKLYTNMFAHITAFSLIALLFLIFTIILIVNIENRNMLFIFTVLNIILIGYVGFVYGIDIINNIDTFFETNIFKNIYFFLGNTIISLIIIIKYITSKKSPKNLKYAISVCYYFIIVNLVLMLFMSSALQNIILLVLGNTYPMIYFGNIAAFIMYGILLLYILCFKPKTRKHRFGDHV